MKPSETTQDSVFVHDIEQRSIAPWHGARNSAIRLLRRVEPYGQSSVLLALRLLYGWQFAQTGWGKLMNLERTGGFFDSIGIPAPLAMAALVGAIELTGGLMFVFGAGTRFAAAALTNVMVVALLTAHAGEAFTSLTAFTEQAPYPFLVASLLFLVFGAGWFSVDGWFRSRSRVDTDGN